MKRKLKKRIRTFVIMLLVGTMIWTGIKTKEYIEMNHLFPSNKLNGHEKLEPAFSLYSQYALLVKSDSLEVLFEKNADESMYPASLTKIMTTIVLIEMIDDLNQYFEVTENIIDEVVTQNASVAELYPYEWFTAKDLLYGVMLPSGADALLSLVYGLGYTQDEFVDLMNQKANALGMTKTHYQNPTGLHHNKHVTSMKDMAKLLQYALNNSVFRQIYTAHDYWIEEDGDHYSHYFESTTFASLSQTSFDWGKIIGGKTGYTGQSGLNLSTLAVDNHNQEYLLITGNAGGDLTSEKYHMLDAYNIYDYFIPR